MWSGSIASIPAGWVLCDGTLGTPDLRDRFIIGAGGSRSVNNTGGAETHTHGVGSYAGPSHTHLVPHSGWSNVTATAGGNKLTSGKGELEQVMNADHTSGVGGTGTITGISDSESNLPPFFAAGLYHETITPLLKTIIIVII